MWNPDGSPGELHVALEAAERALDEDDRPGALAQLLAAWRASRSPRIADLCDRLDETLALAPITGATRERFQTVWIDTAGLGREVDVPRLMASVGQRPFSHFADRLDRLAQREDDPRIALGLARFLERELPTNAIREHTWIKMFRLLEAVADARVREPLAARLASLPLGELGRSLELSISRLFTRLPPLDAALPPELDAPIAALEARVASLPVLSDEARIFVVNARTTSVVTEEELVARILEAPDNDAPRHVYADWLSEREDPRGAFLRLQLTEKRSKAQEAQTRRLLKAHAPRWLGPLEPVVVQPVFERGFLASCAVRFRTAKQRADLTDHPLWSTLRFLWGGADDPAFLLGCTLRDLRGVQDPLPLGLLAPMAVRDRPYALEEARIAVGTHSADEGTALRSASALPKLERITLIVPYDAAPPRPSDLAWLFHGALGQRLGALHAYHPELPFETWLSAVEGLASVRRFGFSGGGLCTLERDAPGAPWRLDLAWYPDFTADRLNSLDRWLSRIAHTLDAVVVRPHPEIGEVDLEPVLLHLRERYPSLKVRAATP